MFSKKHLRILVVLTGFVSLAVQTLGYKTLFLVFTENIHATALVLSSFLAGLGVSAFLVTRYVQKKPQRAVSILYILTICVIGYTFAVLGKPGLLETLFTGISLVGKSLIAWMYMFLPALALGGTFPILASLYQNSLDTKAKDLGEMYALDIIGSVLGTLTVAFVFLPVFGLQRTVLLVCVLAIISAILLISKAFINKKKVQSGRILLSVAVILLLFDFFGVTLRSPIPYNERFGEILFQEDSPYGVITIGERDDPYLPVKDARLWINYRDMCSSLYPDSEYKLAQNVLDSFDAQPRFLKMMNIGFGCGFTAQKISTSEKVKEFNLYEINPVIANNSERFFHKPGFGPSDQEVTTITIKDGAEVLRSEEKPDDLYDSIIIDVEEPSVIQSLPLFTVEYMRHAARHLSEDGVMALWAIGEGKEIYNQILFKTIKEVFPYTYLYQDSKFNIHVYGSRRPLPNIESQENVYVYDLAELVDVPVNTIDNKALQAEYSIETVFNLPKKHFDEFVK